MPKVIPTQPPSETALAVQHSQTVQSYQPRSARFEGINFSDYGITPMDAGLIFTRDLTKDEWKTVGTHLRKSMKAVLWWVGDWILYGEKMYSVTIDQRDEDKRNLKRLGHGMAMEMAKITGYSPGTISNIKSVCLRVNLPWRHDELTVQHASEILRAVPDAQFPYWAHRVLSENLSTKDVRIELRKSLRTESASPATKRPTLFAQKHVDFVREFMAESEKWTEAEVQAHAAWHDPILKFFRSRGL